MKAFLLKGLIAICIFASLASAEIVWEHNFGTQLYTGPTKASGVLAVSGVDGIVYFIGENNIQIGAYRAGALVKDVDAFQNLIIISSGKEVSAVTGYTTRIWQVVFNDTVIGTGIDDGIYVTTLGEMAKLTSDGQKVFSVKVDALTEPVITGGLGVGVGAANGFYLYDKAGKLLWNIKSGAVVAKPTWAANFFIGTESGEVIKVNTQGEVIWKRGVDGAVMAPVLASGDVYVLTGKGYAYALSDLDGSVLWKTYIGKTVLNAELIVFGGRTILIGEGEDGYLLAIDGATGELLLNADYGQNSVGFVKSGSYIYYAVDSMLYKIGLNRACSITEPIDGSTIGVSPVGVQGKVIGSSPKVFIRIDEGEWNEAEVKDNSFSLLLEHNDVQAGVRLIECKVSDSTGEDTKYGSIKVYKDIGIPAEKMFVKFSGTIKEDQSFDMFVVNYKGFPIPGVNVTIDGQSKKTDANGKVTFKLGSGKHFVRLSKAGYANTEFTINLGVDLIVIAVAVVVVLVTVYFFVLRKKK
ncbi:MAG: PQQ-binding-like beta-propeller repeat protein [Candidatus Anstonellales archaeon]